jgi:hypothetical protein
MTSASIRLPQRKDLASVLEFARDIEYHSAREEIEIDFGEETFFPPFFDIVYCDKAETSQFKKSKYDYFLR